MSEQSSNGDQPQEAAAVAEDEIEEHPDVDNGEYESPPSSPERVSAADAASEDAHEDDDDDDTEEGEIVEDGSAEAVLDLASPPLESCFVNTDPDPDADSRPAPRYVRRVLSLDTSSSEADSEPAPAAPGDANELDGDTDEEGVDVSRFKSRENTYTYHETWDDVIADDGEGSDDDNGDNDEDDNAATGEASTTTFFERERRPLDDHYEDDDGEPVHGPEIRRQRMREFKRQHRPRVSERVVCLAKEVTEFYNNLYKQGKLCDAVLISSDGVKFSVHRTFLAAKSFIIGSWFKWRNGNDRTVVNLPTLDGARLGYLLELLYTEHESAGEGFIHENNCASVLQMATEFNIGSLLHACRDYYARSVNTQNCIAIWKSSTFYFHPEVAGIAFRYILSNFDEVYMQNEDYVELTSSELVEILDDDRLFVCHEHDALGAIARWVLHSPKDRERHSTRLLKCVRFGMMRNKNGRLMNRDDLLKALPQLNQWVTGMRYISHLPDQPFRYRTRERHNMPRVPRFGILTIGGWSGGSPTDVVECYDHRADAWYTVPGLQAPFMRAYHGCVVLGSKIYIFGGYDSQYFYNSLNMFDTAQPGLGWRTMSCMNHARCYVTCCVFNGEIWAIGGLDGTSRMRTVEKYNVERNQWDMVSSMLVPRSDACATVHNGRVHVAGGFDGHNVLHSVEFFNERTGYWEFAAGMNVRRSGLSGIDHDGRFIVLGGFTGDTRTNKVEMYDDATNAWIELPPMSIPKSNFATVQIEDLLYTFGGYDGNRTIPLVECYDPKWEDAALAWRRVRPMPTAKSALGVAIIVPCPATMSYRASLDAFNEMAENDADAAGENSGNRLSAGEQVDDGPEQPAEVVDEDGGNVEPDHAGAGIVGAFLPLEIFADDDEDAEGFDDDGMIVFDFEEFDDDGEHDP